jgi:hypothetical protein
VPITAAATRIQPTSTVRRWSKHQLASLERVVSPLGSEVCAGLVFTDDEYTR